MISPDLLSTTTYGYQTAIAFVEATEVQMTLCLKFLGMSQVTTQVSETKISDALVTGHRASELVGMVQYIRRY